MRRKRPLLKNLLILLFFCIVSALTLVWRLESGSKESNFSPAVVKSGGNRSVDDMILKGMPEPKEFEHFTYKGEESLEIELNCDEKYATVLIYPSSVDYRFDPLSAKINRAFDCLGERQLTEYLDIRSANLENGLKYYVIKAHQDDDGIWHNPY